MLIGLVLLHSPLLTFLIFSALALSPARAGVCRTDLHILNQGGENLWTLRFQDQQRDLGQSPHSLQQILLVGLSLVWFDREYLDHHF